MLNNIDLFNGCLLHKEPLIDPYYCSDGLIISSSPTAKKTHLMEVNLNIINRITAIKVALDDGNDASIQAHLSQLLPLLNEKSVNFTEFTSFFPALDVSYSIYKKLSVDEKIDFLMVAVKAYIEKRHTIYQGHGYSPVTLQVRKDFEKHKTGGNAANKKARDILLKNGYSAAAVANDFFKSGLKFAFLDDAGLASSILAILKKDYGLTFEWSKIHQNKSADLVFKNESGKIFICEMKHMKEGGGGQDKQVSELISLVSYGEKNSNIGYVSFLDGIYFNGFIKPTLPKTLEQIRQINKYLKVNNNNYFVNTWGFGQLLKKSS